MSITNISDLVVLNEVLNDSFDLAYSEALASKENWAATLANVAPTRQRAVNFPFVYNDAGLGLVEEGEAPQYNTLVGESVRIALKKLQGGVQIKQLDFEDPFFQSMLIQRAQGIATQAAYHPLNRIINALSVGDTDSYYTMYDGQQFFSNTHSINGVTYDNLMAGALDSTNFNLVKSRLKRIPWGPDGSYLPMTGASFYLVVPPELEQDAMELMNSSYKPVASFGHVTNVFQGAADIIVDEGLSDVDDWYMVATLPSMKPFVTVQHETLGNRALVPETDPESDAVKNHDEYRWTLKSFEETFPAQFWLSVKVKN